MNNANAIMRHKEVNMKISERPGYLGLVYGTATTPDRPAFGYITLPSTDRITVIKNGRKQSISLGDLAKHLALPRG